MNDFKLSLQDRHADNGLSVTLRCVVSLQQKFQI